MNLGVYVINVIVCISIIIFCGVKVLTDPRPETTSIYLPIMSGIVGYFVPNPAFKKKENTGDRNNPISNSLNQLNTNSQFTNNSQQSGSNPPPSPPLSPSITIDIPNRINSI
jgi:hypothetical protein